MLTCTHINCIEAFFSHSSESLDFTFGVSIRTLARSCQVLQRHSREKLFVLGRGYLVRWKGKFLTKIQEKYLHTFIKVTALIFTSFWLVNMAHNQTLIERLSIMACFTNDMSRSFDISSPSLIKSKLFKKQGTDAMLVKIASRVCSGYSSIRRDKIRIAHRT